MATARHFSELYELLSKGTGWSAYLKPESIKTIPLPERSDLELEALDALCEKPQTHSALAIKLHITNTVATTTLERFTRWGWVTAEKMKTAGPLEWRYTLTDAGRRAAIEPCLPPTPCLSRDDDRQTRRRKYSTFGKPQSPRQTAIPYTQPDRDQHIYTIARWIKLSDLHKESGPCEIVKDGVVTTAPPPKPERPKQVSTRKLDPINDPRVSEVLQLHAKGLCIDRIRRTLHMNWDSVARILDANKDGAR